MSLIDEPALAGRLVVGMLAAIMGSTGGAGSTVGCLVMAQAPSATFWSMMGGWPEASSTALKMLVYWPQRQMFPPRAFLI